jgi:acyl-CoA synthetase (AMP-forming)/AMP-acid ligase II
MRRAAHGFAEKEAVKQGDRSLTFSRAWERGCRLANYLRGLGLQPGDRVAVLEDNCLEASDAFLGIGIANLVRVPLYARNSPESHEYMLRNTDCKAAIVAEHYAEELIPAQKNLDAFKHVLVRDDRYEALLSAQSPEDPMIEIQPDDYYIIRHTGGTTGSPKGVAYTHWSWLATARDWFYSHPPVEPGDTCLHVAPISHASGYWFIPVWICGGRNIMLEKFDASIALDLLERERVSYFLTVPTMTALLNEEPSAAKRDYSALKCFCITAAPVSDATALKAREIFGDVLYQAYGQTEAVGVTFMGPREWFANVEGSNPLRACGRVTSFARLEIRDDDNKSVPYGTPGQIAARIDGQMKGYWNNPKATAERLIDGWVLTGDVGMIDKNGYVYLLDRADDMIVSGGFNIYPLEVENVIHSHPSVLEVAVFGVPHPKWGEAPLAAIYLKPGERATEQEIIDLCTKVLGSYKKPHQVVFMNEPLPKTPVGKLRRKDLREPYWAGQERRISGS